MIAPVVGGAAAAAAGAAISRAVLAILEVVAVALTADEALTALEELYESSQLFKGSLEEAKKLLAQEIEKLKQEIATNIDDKFEEAFLFGLAVEDPQSMVTQKAEGRGVISDTIKLAIQQKIPFRKIISSVCSHADRLPILTLRKKKGVTVKDMANAKRAVLEKIAGKLFEEIADEDLDGFILVQLKMLMTGLVFEFIDKVLDWKSPLKVEVGYGKPPGYADPKMDGGTTLKRLGRGISPFYPTTCGKGGLVADLVIPERRHQPPGKHNIFAIVEIKFQNDRMDEKQFDNYKELLKSAAQTKTKHTTITYKGKSVTIGGHLSLFRWPEDQAVDKKEEEKKDDENNSKQEANEGKDQDKGKSKNNTGRKGRH